MAKPLSPKSKLIREAIGANPDLKPKALADLINSSDARKGDKMRVTPTDVATQQQAMKKAAKPKKAASKKPGRKAQTGAISAQGLVPPRKPAPAAASPVEIVDRVFDLAQQCGGFEQLKRLVDRLAAR